MSEIDEILIFNAGLAGFHSWLVDSYIGPAFLIIISIFGAILAWQRRVREAVVAAAVFIIAALFIFLGGAFFGEDGKLTTAGGEIADNIVSNTVDLSSIAPARS